MILPSIRDWQKIPEFLSGKWPLPNPQYFNTTFAASCSDYFDKARHAPFVAIDTEYVTDTSFLLLVGLGYPGMSQVLQFDHKHANWQDRLQYGSLLRDLVSRVPVVFQNAMADIPILEKAYGITYSDYHKIDDTMLAHAVLWSDWPHTLEFLASIYGHHNKLKHLSGIDDNLYNAGDVVDTISAWEGLQKELRSDPLTKGIYVNQSLNLIPIITKSQSRGLRVNKARVESALRELSAAKQWAQDIATGYAGYPLNIGSDDQLKYFLYERERLPRQFIPRTTRETIDGDAIAALRSIEGPIFDADDEAQNGLSVDEAARRISQGGHPVLEGRVVYAAAQQALSHYVLAMCEVDKKGHMVSIRDTIYPRFLPHSQASGRWSTVDPPMAQIPKTLQDLVIPFEGEKWVEWDWDQIELRILGALSGDDVYYEAFKHGWDIHTIHTCDVFGWPYPSDKANPHTSQSDHAWRTTISWGGKDDPRRRFAKVFIFRLNYGGEAKTATDIPGVKQLGLKPKDLVAGSQAYLARHPKIRQYWNSIVARGIRNREVRTSWGRRRRLLVDGKSAMRRLILNHPMQGGVSDVFNQTMVQVSRRYPTATFAYGVHDAQKWAVAEGSYSEMRQGMQRLIMEPWDINGQKVIFPATFK